MGTPALLIGIGDTGSRPDTVIEVSPHHWPDICWPLNIRFEALKVTAKRHGGRRQPSLATLRGGGEHTGEGRLESVSWGDLLIIIEQIITHNFHFHNERR